MMFIEKIFEGIHNFNLMGNNYILLSERNLIGLVALGLAAIIAIVLLIKGIGAIGRAIFKR